MAFEDLLKSVEESAEEQQKELRKKATTSVGEIQARAKTRAAEVRQALIDDAKKSIETEKNKLLYLAKAENKELLITAREAAFEKAFAEAGRRLAVVRSEPAYPAIFERLLGGAMEAFGDGPFILHVDKRDEELGKKTLRAMGRENKVEADITTAGGVLLSMPDRSIVISNTIESRLLRARETKRQEIHAILTG